MRIPLVAIGALACLLISGCASVEARPGVTKVSGSYIRLMPAAPELLGHAAEYVCHEMGLMMIGSGPTAEGWTVQARNSQDTRFTVYVTAAGAGASQVAVNIEPGEDEGLSLQMLDQIQQQLHN